MGNPIRKLSSYGIALLLFMGFGVTISSYDQSEVPSLRISINQAQAYNDHRGEIRRGIRREVRRDVRRTVRRVNRRHQYYHALPRGCHKVFFNGLMHHRCGGIYYMPRFDNGQQIYIIINP